MTSEQKRELLELAAKAAGIVGRRYVENEAIQGEIRTGMWGDLTETLWNPLDSAGDALNLAIRLRLKMRVCNSGARAWESEGGSNVKKWWAPKNDDIYKATRLAIVLAAAAIERDKQ